MKLILLATALLLGACSQNWQEPRANVPPPPPPVTAQLEFQNGQKITVQLDQKDLALRNAFISWVNLGAYNTAPVYRQLPGLFVLAGKPRLMGRPFIQGQFPTPQDAKKYKEPPTTHSGQIGLVKHPDGSAGPEIILQYGTPIVSCCEAPQNIRIGTIIQGRLLLNDVQRGDNLQNIAIQP